MKTLNSRALGLFVLAVSLAGCDREGTRTITESRVASKPFRAVKLDATSAERFDMARHMGGAMPGAEKPDKGPAQGSPHGQAKLLVWDLPPGWKEKPAEQMRQGSFAVAGNPEADCSIVLLPGEAGGLDANVNRWLAQVGAPALSHEAIAALPARALLGAKGTVIEGTGTYTGMGQGQDKPGFKLVGVISQRAIRGNPATCFLKMVGPAAVIDAERAHFDALCDSIKTPLDGADEPAPPENTAPVEWTAPSEWRRLGAAPMRVVSFGAATQSECYVSVLPGDAGGLAANLNRWRGQLGMPALDDASIAALPKVKLLGQDVPLIEAAGSYTDMQGQAHTSYAMLGAVGKKGDSSVFVRMLGPEAELKSERERFVAFASSLR